MKMTPISSMCISLSFPPDFPSAIDWKKDTLNINQTIVNNVNGIHDLPQICDYRVIVSALFVIYTQTIG